MTTANRPTNARALDRRDQGATPPPDVCPPCDCGAVRAVSAMAKSPSETGESSRGGLRGSWVLLMRGNVGAVRWTVRRAVTGSRPSIYSARAVASTSPKRGRHAATVGTSTSPACGSARSVGLPRSRCPAVLSRMQPRRGTSRSPLLPTSRQAARSPCGRPQRRPRLSCRHRRPLHRWPLHRRPQRLLLRDLRHA